MDRVSDVTARRRARLSLVLLLPALLAIVFAAAMARWHSSIGVDNRTYLEMIVGIAEHGLPYTSNGPVGRYPELQARWNRVADGKLWGTLPPVFPYVATPVFMLGGVRGVIRLNILLLGVLALGVYALGRRLARDPFVGTAAAYVTLFGTPVISLGLDSSPYVWATACSTWATVFALRAMDSTNRRSALRAAATCGVLGALATGAHPLAFPPAVALIAALALRSARSDQSALRRLYDLPWLGAQPRRQSFEQAAVAAGGFAAAMAPVGLLNYKRFGSWNPVTYGPCVWRSCAETGLDRQSIGEMLRYAAPVAAWLGGIVALWFLLRRSPVARRVAVGGAVLAVAPPSLLHDRLFGLATTLCAFVLDMSTVHMGYGFFHPPDGWGNFLGPWAVKAALQSSPVLLVAAVAPTARLGRARVAALGVSVIALLIVLSMRASLPTAFGLGYPFLHMRYVVPIMPVLVVLALAAVASLSWRWRDVASGVAVVAVATWLLARGESDFDRTRRVAMLWGTLALAVAALVASARALEPRRTAAWGRVARPLIVLAVAASIAVNVGVDLRVTVALRRETDRRIDAVARQTPQRFALVGWPNEIDSVLALRATRDVTYADLYEAPNWSGFRALIDVWTAEGRPIYALFATGRETASPWPDVRFECIDRGVGLYGITVVPPRTP